MNEVWFTQVSEIVVGIEIFMDAVCMVAFFYPFMTDRKEQEKSRLKKALMIFLIYTVMRFVPMPISRAGWLRMVIELILLVAVSGFLDMERGFTFLLGVLFFCIRNLSVVIVESISYFLSKHREYIAGITANSENIYRHAVWSYILVSALRLALFL